MATNGNPAFLCQKANLIDADNARMHPVLLRSQSKSLLHGQRGQL
jgi:hypothetical protein